MNRGDLVDTGAKAGGLQVGCKLVYLLAVLIAHRAGLLKVLYLDRVGVSQAILALKIKGRRSNRY